MPFVFDPISTPSKSGSDIVEEVYRLFLSGQREEINKLAVTAGASSNSLSFQYDLGAIRNGSQVEVDLETYYVWEVDESGKTATVEPGMNGSKTAVHASGSIVRVNPKLARAAIFDALNAEIQAISSPTKGLFSVMGLEFVYTPPVITYDLIDTTDIFEIISVSQIQPGASKDWAQLPGWRLDNVVNPVDFPSGNSLFVPVAIPGRTIRVVYSTPFATIDSPSDDLYLDSGGDPKPGGVPPSMHDILVYGILLRLGPIREVKRNFTEAQGDSKRSTEVPAGAVMNSYSELRRLYTQRIQDEATRLSRYFPMARPQ